MTQRAIAEAVEDTETSLSGKLGGSRGITDEFVDRFAEHFEIPFMPGVPESLASEPPVPYGKVLVDAEVFNRLITSTEVQSRLLLEMMNKVDALLKNSKPV